MNYKKKKLLQQIRKAQNISRCLNNQKNNLEKKEKNRIKKIEAIKTASENLRLHQIKFDSPNERKFRHLLIEYGIKHVWQQPFLCDKRHVCVDFYFPEHNIVIEIDGIEHDAVRDAERTRYIKGTHNVKEVLRITNRQLITNREDIIELVLSKLQ